MNTLFRRLLHLLRASRHDAELYDEMETHRALRQDALERRGLGRDDAAGASRRAMGNVALAVEDAREVWAVRILDNTRRDVRSACRAFRKSPGFAIVAVGTLALGIGATTAIFSVVYGVLLKPLPFHDPDRLVALYHLMPGWGPDPRGPQSSATYFTYRDNALVFEDIGVWNSRNVSIIRNGEPEEVQALVITDGLLSLLGVRPELGHLIRPEDDVPGAPARVILTHGYWRRAFGAAPEVAGQSLTIDGSQYEITGVLPASFRFLNTHPQVLLPLKLDRAQAAPGAGFGHRGVARLKPGVTLSQANDDIARMIPLIAEQFPLPPGVTRQMWDDVGLAPNVRPLSEDVIGEMRRPLWILLATVSVVLLMAWANVANLLLVRAEGRQQELAVRTALGASRGRVALELLSESLMLGLAGAALGVAFAQAGIGVLRRMAPVALPRVDEIALDPEVLLVTLLVSVLTSLAFGFIPVIRYRAHNVAALQGAWRSASDAPGRLRTRNALVVAQTALALLLLVASGLMVRTFVAMRQVEPGFVGPDNVQTFRIALPAAIVPARQQVAMTYEQIAERLAHVPGVAAVGLANRIPLDGSPVGGPIAVEDRPVAGTPPFRRGKSIGPGFFETLGNPLMAGRTVTWSDVHQSTRSVWISENLAREYWQEPAQALGKRIGDPAEWWEVVGVFGNVREDGLNQPAPTFFYLPAINRDMAFVVRSDRVGTPDFLGELQRAVWSVNPNLPLAGLQTLDEIQVRSMAQTSFAMTMLSIAATVALMFGVVGIYGVVTYMATQRTREIGIRMAFGAQVGDVRAMVLRHGLRLMVAGIVLGVAVALAVTRVMSSLLFGVGPMDPVTYAAMSATLAGVGLLATYLPARRASRVDPVVALRVDA
jgi:predicted permease